YADAIEARDADEGTVLWRREGLDAAGLQTGSAISSKCGPAVGWAGQSPGDGQPVLALVCLESGDDQFRTPLERPPVGPPQRVRGGWVVPLEAGRLGRYDADGQPLGVQTLPAPISPPLVELLGLSAAWIGSPTRLLPLGPHRRRGLPRAVDPQTVLVDGEWVFAAGDREFAAWRCRRGKGRRLRCHRQWRQRVGASVTAPPILTEELVLVPCWDTFVYAFQRRSGHLVWRARDSHRLKRAGLVWDESVGFVPAASARVRFVWMADGQAAASVRGSDGEVFLTGAARDGNRLLVPTLTFPAEEFVLRVWELELDPDRAPSAESDPQADTSDQERGESPPPPE
ncbi:MAG: hypothetical protein JSV80_10330, partial [Acidobacteriota bacterium]